MNKSQYPDNSNNPSAFTNEFVSVVIIGQSVITKHFDLPVIVVIINENFKSKEILNDRFQYIFHEIIYKNTEVHHKSASNLF